MGPVFKQSISILVLGLSLLSFSSFSGADYWDNSPKRDKVKQANLDIAMNRYINNYVEKSKSNQNFIQPSLSSKPATVADDLEAEFDKMNPDKKTEREPTAESAQVTPNNTEESHIEKKEDNP